MFNIKTLLLIGIIFSLLTSGCASYRVLTNLKPESDATLQSPAGRFYIAGVKYTVDGDDRSETKKSTGDIDAVYKSSLLPLVRKECLARYPMLFTEDSSDSVSIWIKVDETFTPPHPLHDLAWILGTVYMCPLFLPMPQDWKLDITVTLGRGKSREDFKNNIATKSFQREEYRWFSIYTPLALIDIPGESDFPKESDVFGSFDYVPQVAQQVATAIAKLVATKEPEFWTTQPRANPSSTFSPTRPVSPSVVLPLPPDAVDPF